MFDFLKRSQLVKRGLASRKTRRRVEPNEFIIIPVCDQDGGFDVKVEFHPTVPP